MFLTRKSFTKILVLAIFCFLFGTVSIAAGILFLKLGSDSFDLLACGAILYSLSFASFYWGRYAEGTGKIVNLGNRLVRTALKPAEFIKQYEIIRNADDLVVKKPSTDVLQLVANAYHLMGNREMALLTIDEMIEVADEKKKPFARLCKVSLLFAFHQKEEAEILYNEVRGQKLDVLSRSLADAILKSDRAMAMGDYKTAENTNLSNLERSFPKQDNLGKLSLHYSLGEIYEQTEDTDKAILHYQYCADFGGETSLRVSALEKLRNLNQE